MTFAQNALPPPCASFVRYLVLASLLVLGVTSLPALASTAGHVSEVNLVLPDLADSLLVSFLGGMSGSTLLSYGLVVAIGGLFFRCRYLPPDS